MSQTMRKSKTHRSSDELGSDLNQFVTTTEAAELLGVLRTSVNHLIYDGRIQGKKFGRDWLVFRPSIQTYVENKSSKGRPSTKAPKLNKHK